MGAKRRTGGQRGANHSIHLSNHKGDSYEPPIKKIDGNRYCLDVPMKGKGVRGQRGVRGVNGVCARF